MRRWIAAAGIVIHAASLVWAAPDTQGLSSGDEKVRLETSATLAKAKAEAVPALLTAMNGENPTGAKMADETLAKIVHAAAGTPDAPAVAAALVTQLGAGKPGSRRQVCDYLGFLGPDEKAAQALAGFLTDKELAEPARMALVRMAGPAATTVLVGAMGKADEPTRIAILNGLAQKGDPAAVPAITELTSAPSEALRQAAWHAIARIPAKDSVALFKTAVEKKDPIATAMLLNHAESLLAAGMLLQADAVLKLRNQAGPVGGLDKCRMLRAHARLGTPESMDLILGALDETDVRIHGAAYEAAAVLPGTEVTRAITMKMNAATGPVKIELLGLLGRRGRQMDERTVMLMYMAMLDKDDAVKVACIRAMQDAEVTATLPTLVNVVRGPAGPVSDAAEQALSRIPGPIVTAHIVEALQNSTPEGKVRLLRPLEVRADPAALPAVIRETANPDAGVRAAAYRCLGRLGSDDAYDALAAAFDGPPGADRDAAEMAMMALRSDVITAKLLSGYFSASEGQKPSMLRVLGKRQMEAIDALLLSEATSPDEAIRTAAVQGLAMRDKPAMAAPLLTAAKAGPPAITAAALTGYLNIAASVEQKDKAAAAGMYVEAFKLASADEQRKVALLGLGRVAEASDELVSGILPLLTTGNAKDEAAMALAGLAARMPEGQSARASEVLQKVASDSRHAPAQEIAIRRLRELGIQVDPARAAGFITEWWLLGPIERHGDADWDRLPDVLQQVDVSKPTKIGSRELTWKQYHTPSPQGIVNLSAGLGSVTSTAAYAYAEVTVDAAQDAVLKTGSDDGMAAWVNGQKLHSTNASRPVQIDQDVVKVSLKPGKNAIVVRIQQGGGDWGFCVRLVTPDGKPIGTKSK